MQVNDDDQLELKSLAFTISMVLVRTCNDKFYTMYVNGQFVVNCRNHLLCSRKRRRI
jgi:hypothetical protein